VRYEGYYDWKWVELKDAASKVTLDLAVDPSRLGELEVSLPTGSKQWIVVYVPVDEEGQLPLPAALTYRMLSSSALVEDDRAVIRNLREGKYQIMSASNSSSEPRSNFNRTRFTAQAVVEVKRGETTSTTLTPAKTENAATSIPPAAKTAAPSTPPAAATPASKPKAGPGTENLTRSEPDPTAELIRGRDAHENALDRRAGQGAK
jgi:hypothetical protein